MYAVMIEHKYTIYVYIIAQGGLLYSKICPAFALAQRSKWDHTQFIQHAYHKVSSIQSHRITFDIQPVGLVLECNTHGYRRGSCLHCLAVGRNGDPVLPLACSGDT